MPFNDTACLVLAAARRHLADAPSAVELFVQTLDGTDVMFEHLRHDPRMRREVLDELRALSMEERRPHMRRFYEALGFSSWTAIDSYPGPDSIVMDLNDVLAERYGYRQQFDLVSNKGSTEHVFDQRAVFTNMHNLCKVGGVLVHDVPTINIFNHALFGYHPLFLCELAEANGYEILDLRMGNRWGDTVGVRLDPAGPPPLIDYLPDLGDPALALPPFIDLADFLAKAMTTFSDHPLTRLYDLLEHRGRARRADNPGEIFTIGILRKVADTPFQLPYQGKFLKFIRTPDFQERYRNQLRRAGFLD